MNYEPTIGFNLVTVVQNRCKFHPERGPRTPMLELSRSVELDFETANGSSHTYINSDEYRWFAIL